MQSAGTSAFHKAKSVGVDMCPRRRAASAWNAWTKSPRDALERERPDHGVQLCLRENLLHRRGRLLDLLEQPWLS